MIVTTLRQYVMKFEQPDGSIVTECSEGFDPTNSNTVYETYDKDGFRTSVIYCPYVPEFTPKIAVEGFGNEHIYSPYR